MADITLNPAQRAALAELMEFATGGGESPLCTLEGYAGTGKTTLVCALLEALADEDMALAAMAPTNKAVGVLEAKIQPMVAASVEFGSLHSFLGLRMHSMEDGSQKAIGSGEPSLHKYDLAIVDECSMVSEELFKAILLNRRSCRVLFVGDSAQLPPVGDDGRESPVFRLVSKRVRLSEVVRQARGNPIVAASVAVRHAIEQMRRVSLVEIADALPPPPASAGFIPGGVDSAIAVVEHEIRRGVDCRAVAWTNAAVDAVNLGVHSMIHPECQGPFAVGERVMAGEEFSVKQGARTMRVFNSEEMVVAAIEPCIHPDTGIPAWSVDLTREGAQLVRAFVPSDQRDLDSRIAALWRGYRALKAAGDTIAARKASAQAWALKRAFAPLRHTYAITAHKSQGSTFDTSIVVWDDLMRCRSDFDFNRLLYVSMTRAATNMAIVTQ